jgi:hypothetical protein
MATLVTLAAPLALFAPAGDLGASVRGCLAGFDTHPIRAGPHG